MVFNESERRFETIKAPIYIYHLLTRLLSEYKLFQLSPGDSNERFTSALLKIDKDSFSIDIPYHIYLTFPDDHLEYRSKFQAELSESELTFQASYIETYSDDGLLLYRYALPDAIEFAQQRDSHRVNLRDAAVHVNLTTQSGEAIEAILMDISPGGVRVEIDRNYECLIHPEMVLHCKIDRIESLGEAFRIEACHVIVHTEDEEQGQVIIGARFLTASARQRHHISQEVARLERQLLRKEPGLLKAP